MRKRRLQLLRGVAALLLVFCAVGAGICRFNRPQMKEYVLHGYGDAQLARMGVRFAYPADLQVRNNVAPGAVRVEPVTPTGLALWIEKVLHGGQPKEWSNLIVSFDWADADIDKAEANERKSLLQTPQTVGQVRRVGRRLGPAILVDGQTGLPNNTTMATYIYTIYSKELHTTNSPLLVTVGYTSSPRLAPKLRQVVDDIVASMQIVPL